MNIHADNTDGGPPHGLLVGDVRRILATVSTAWISELREVRLSNSQEYYAPYAFFSPFDGRLTVYSRCGTVTQAVAALLSALAVEVLGINRGIGRHRSQAEQDRVAELIQPFVTASVASMPRSRNLSPEAHTPWHASSFPNDAD